MYNDMTSGLPAEVRGAAHEVATQADDTFNIYSDLADRDALPVFDLRKLDGPEPRELDWIIPGFIPRGEVGLLTGAGGDGKSLLAQQLANCLAANRKFLGHECDFPDPMGAVYVTCEEGEDELHRRQRHLMRSLGVARDDLDEGLFLSSLRGVDEGTELVTFDPDGTAKPTQVFERLKKTIYAVWPDLIILDNIAHLFGGNENDRRQVTAFVNQLYRLIKITKCAILLIGHPNKSGDTFSGSTAWLNAVRFHLHLDRMQDESGFEADPDRRVLRVGKANYAKKGEEIQFRWHDHAFVCDDDLPEDTRKGLAEAQRAATENQIFLECLRKRSEQNRHVGPHPSANYAPAQFEQMTEAKGLKRKALTRAMERLFHIGAIEVQEVKREGKGGTKTIIAEAPERLPERVPNTDTERPEALDRTTPHTPPYT